MGYKGQSVSRGFRPAQRRTLKQSTIGHRTDKNCLPLVTMEEEKLKAVPEVRSVSSTVDAQEDASTKSLVSCVVSIVKRKDCRCIFLTFFGQVAR